MRERSVRACLQSAVHKPVDEEFRKASAERSHEHNSDDNQRRESLCIAQLLALRADFVKTLLTTANLQLPASLSDPGV